MQAATINRRLLLRSAPTRGYPRLRHAAIPIAALLAGLAIGYSEWFEGFGDVVGEPTVHSVMPRDLAVMAPQQAAPIVSTNGLAPDLPSVQALGLLKPADDTSLQAPEAAPPAPATPDIVSVSSQPAVAGAAFVRRDGPPLPMTGSLDMGNQRITVAVEPKPQVTPATSSRSVSGVVSTPAKPLTPPPTVAPAAAKVAPKPAAKPAPAAAAKPAIADSKAKPRDPCAEALRGRTSIATSDLGVRSLLPGKLVFMVGDHTCTLSAGTQLGDDKVSRIDAERLRIETNRGAIQLLDQ